jgi:hypothetical protein
MPPSRLPPPDLTGSLRTTLLTFQTSSIHGGTPVALSVPMFCHGPCPYAYVTLKMIFIGTFYFSFFHLYEERDYRSN